LSLAASGTLSKFFGLKATNKPFLASEDEAAGSDVVSTSTATRPAPTSWLKRLKIAEPPERNISTLMPVWASNILLILLACSIGVEVYQTTLPSFFAAARSAISSAVLPINENAIPANHVRTASVARDKRIVTSLACDQPRYTGSG